MGLNHSTASNIDEFYDHDIDDDFYDEDHNIDLIFDDDIDLYAQEDSDHPAIASGKGSLAAHNQLPRDWQDFDYGSDDDPDY